MSHLNKLIGTAIETFGKGFKQGGCGVAIERTSHYLEELEQAADSDLLHEVHQLHTKVEEQREALTLLMRYRDLTNDNKVSDNSPVSPDTPTKTKIIPLNPTY